MGKKRDTEPLVPGPDDEEGDGCWNCRYCMEVVRDTGKGDGWVIIESRECRLNPPVPILFSPESDIPDAFGVVFGWPDLVGSEEAWCSHHKPRRGEEGRSTLKEKGD